MTCRNWNRSGDPDRFSCHLVFQTPNIAICFTKYHTPRPRNSPPSPESQKQPSLMMIHEFHFFLFCVCLCHIVLSVSCSLVVTCCERADFLALLYVMFSCVFVTFPYGILYQMWYLIVSIPYLCPVLYFSKYWPGYRALSAQARYSKDRPVCYGTSLLKMGFVLILKPLTLKSNKRGMAINNQSVEASSHL